MFSIHTHTSVLTVAAQWWGSGAGRSAPSDTATKEACVYRQIQKIEQMQQHKTPTFAHLIDPHSIQTSVNSNNWFLFFFLFLVFKKQKKNEWNSFFNDFLLWNQHVTTLCQMSLSSAASLLFSLKKKKYEELRKQESRNEWNDVRFSVCLNESQQLQTCIRGQQQNLSEQREKTNMIYLFLRFLSFFPSFLGSSAFKKRKKVPTFSTGS